VRYEHTSGSPSQLLVNRDLAVEGRGRDLFRRAAGFLVWGSVYGGPLYGVVAAAIIFPALLAGWALHRVLKSWVEWPAQRRRVSFVEATVRYLLIDP
jgi:hypothetical protein